MGHLWNIVEAYLDAQDFSVSERELASRLGYSSSSTFDGWRDPKKLPGAEGLARLALLTGTPYRDVLDAALTDAGYLPRPQVSLQPTKRDLERRPGVRSRGQRRRDAVDAASEPPPGDRP